MNLITFFKKRGDRKTQADTEEVSLQEIIPKVVLTPIEPIQMPPLRHTPDINDKFSVRIPGKSKKK